MDKRPHINELIRAQEELLDADAEVIAAGREAYIIQGKGCEVIFKMGSVQTQYEMNQVMNELKDLSGEMRRAKDHLQVYCDKANVTVGRYNKAMDDFNRLNAYFPF